jgi:HAD superfamily hydrolase (TIGR01509 family)
VIKTILFDLDGTIIDTEPQAYQAILELTKEWGVGVTKEDAASVAGKKWEVAFDLLFQKHQMPHPKEVASQKIIQRYQQLVRAKPTIIPGVVEAIQDFAEHFELALVSGSHRADILWALDYLNVRQHFPVILGAEDYPLSKPAPDGYLKALELLSARAEHSLIFEDSSAGIASAHAAKVKVVAISSTNHFQHDQSSAQAIIPDFRGIDARWVKKTFGG